MTLRSRLFAPICALAVLLAACVGPPSTPPLDSGQPATVSETVAPDPEALAAYTAAMCPLFHAILVVDPRIGDVRAAAQAADGGDMSAQTTEMAALSEELLFLLTAHEAVPQWDPGAALRHHLITSLHGIRTAFLRAGRDPGARDAADGITVMPFMATDTLDRAMNVATQSGLACE